MKQRRRGLARKLLVEKLEERVVMDATIFAGNTRVKVIGADARWDTTAKGTCKGLNVEVYSDVGTCVSDKPVNVQLHPALWPIEAPDGGTYDNPSTSPAFFPKNGLIRLDNGQLNSVNDLNSIRFAQQQELDLNLNLDFFPCPNSACSNDSIHTTTLTVPTTGQYTFFVSGTSTASNLTIGNVPGGRLNAKPVGTNSVALTLTAGVVYPVEVNRGPFDTAFRVDWAGPGFSQKRFVPSTNVFWQQFDSFTGDPTPIATGTISVPTDANNTFSLKWNGQQTKLFSLFATAEDVKNALNSLSNIGGVGGAVTVTRSPDRQKFNVLFGGTTWFRPPLISIEGRAGATVTPVSKIAITKRNDQSTLKIDLSPYYNNNGDSIQVSLPDPNILPIDNAPIFTPLKLIARPGENRLQGYLQTPGIGGRFETAVEARSFDDAHVRISSTGFRLIGADSQDTSKRTYALNPLKDSLGNNRPITLLKLGGLDFEAPLGTQALLVAKDGAAQNDLEFQAVGDSMIVSAAYDGGRLNLRLLRDGNAPIYTANLRTGKVTITPKFEFVSFEIGGMVIPSSDSFKMTYDAVAEKFSFTVNNLTVESPHPTGNARNVSIPALEGVTQSFERYGISLAGTTYE